MILKNNFNGRNAIMNKAIGNKQGKISLKISSTNKVLSNPKKL